MNDHAIGNASLVDTDIEKILALLITFFRLGQFMVIPERKVDWNELGAKYPKS